MAWTLLLAAGQGNRLASATGGLAKQFLDWKGAPLYWESTLVFSRCARVEGLVFGLDAECVPRDSLEGCRWRSVASRLRPKRLVRFAG